MPVQMYVKRVEGENMFGNKFKLGFVMVCIVGIIYGTLTENYFGTFWAAVALVTSLK